MTDHAPGGGGAVTVYWRPGCGFCAVLRARLRAARVAFEEVNIWDDPEAAAFVRSVAGGNETVPTVRIGAETLVNPSRRAVIASARVHAPGAVAGVVEPASWGERVRSLLGRRARSRS